MKWFDKLERRFGKYAIHNLMYYIIGIYVLGFAVAMFFPDVYSAYLSLDVEMILRGQIWRLFTFMLQPPSYSLIFILLFYKIFFCLFVLGCWNIKKLNI